MMRPLTAIAALALAALVPIASLAPTVYAQPTAQEQIVRGIIEHVPPLEEPLEGTLQPIRGSRLDGWLPDDDDEARAVLRALHERGVALTPNWRGDHEPSRAYALRLARLQQELGLAVNIHGTRAMTGLFDGDEGTFHLDDEGAPFSWQLLGARKMGCPFRLEGRAEAIRQRWVEMVDAYDEAGLQIDLVSMDWYADGPVEWNEGWEASKRCRVCRERTPQIDDFRAYQSAVRRVRGQLQRECIVEVVQERFPDALIGNWAVYPNDGWRYWYDFYETVPEGASVRREQEAVYRTWADEFSHTGYTYANPVCYPWHDMYGWYPDFPTDFRWAYMALLTASNVGRSAPEGLPIITWVKWRPTPARGDAAPVPAMSLETYREVLAHLLLRGSEGFMMWCRAEETVQEVAAIVPVLNEALKWREFFERGEPVWFHVPRRPGAVVSARRLGDRLLVRRTDFAPESWPVTRRIGDARVTIPPAPGRFMVLQVPQAN